MNRIPCPPLVRLPVLALVTCLALAVMVADAGNAFAQNQAVGGATGGAAPKLPLPRFVSLRSGEANLRTGPGVQYPVDWVYRKKGLPLQVIAEYQSWRKVRDWEGADGWIHQSMLAGARALIVFGETRALRAKAADDAAVTARAEAGVVGRLLECPDGMMWCRVEMGGFEGWMTRKAFWGVLTGETIK